MAKVIKLTGKLKKVENVKGTDRLTLENIDIPSGEAAMALKSCANDEGAVRITIEPVQEKLPGFDKK